MRDNAREMICSCGAAGEISAIMNVSSVSDKSIYCGEGTGELRKQSAAHPGRN